MDPYGATTIWLPVSMQMRHLIPSLVAAWACLPAGRAAAADGLTHITTAPAREARLVFEAVASPMASDGTRVYWYAVPSIMVATPGAEKTAEVFAQLGPLAIVHLFADTGGVIVAAQTQPNRQSAIFTVSKRERKPVELARGSWDIQAMTADDDSVYWIAMAADGEGRGKLLKASRGGGPVETLAAKLRDPWCLALDADQVYFTTMGSAFNNPLGRPDGTIARVAKAGGGVRVLFANQYEPDNLVVAGNDLYWSDSRAARGEDESSGVWRGRKTGGKPQRLTTVDDVVADLASCGDVLALAIPGNARSEAETEGPPVPRGSIRMVSTKGGRLRSVSSQAFWRPGQLTVTGESLLWRDSTGVWSLPLATACPATPPAEARPGPRRE